MQFLRNISGHLFTRPPQPQPSPGSAHPTDLPLPSSDAASERPMRHALSSVPSGSEFAPFDDAFTQQLSPHSYANGSRSARKPPAVRRLSRLSVPHPGLGMPELSRGRDPILKNNTSTSEDERRLFGGDKRPDPQAVQIVPGQTFRKNKVIPSGFKPHDGISRGPRESGPVRARGKERTYYMSQVRSNNAMDNPKRSSKRRRVESPEEAPKRISISDDDHPERGSPVVTRSITAQSPTPSQLSSQVKRPGVSNGGQPSEFRSVDKSTRVPRTSPKKSNSFTHRFSSEDHDVSFIHNAAKQRRGESRFSNAEPAQVSRKLPEQTSNISVEILSKPPTLNGGNTCVSISRESPDELQGGVTVRPVPTSLDSSQTGTIDISSKHSPSDIQPTVFISNDNPKQGIRKTKKRQTSSMDPPTPFTIFYFRWGPTLRDPLGGDNDHIILYPSDRYMCIKIADAAYFESIFLNNVQKVYMGQYSSCKVRLYLSRKEGKDTTLDFRLSSTEERDRLESLLKELDVKVEGKNKQTMDNIFKKSEREHAKYAPASNGIKRPLDVVDAPKEIAQPPQGATKRMKLSDRLQGIDENSAQLISDTALGMRASPSLPATTLSETFKPGRPATPPSGPQRSQGFESPVKKYSADLQATSRATRSMSRKMPTALVCDDDNNDDHDEVHTSQPGLDMDLKWNKKPLVYPKFGKKKAEVNAFDLERLAPSQFLNDNIIGFYIRFLEDHLQRCNPEVAKRVYFFNSYFFATLTNHGKRSINYEGVAKWTRNVDLFSYDHIVVPINEDAHWYLAIICNLPYLEGVLDEANPPASRALSDVQEVPETPEHSQKGDEGKSDPQPPREEIARQSLATMSLLETQQEGSKSGEEDWPEREEFPAICRARFAHSSSQPQPEAQKESETKGTPKKSRKLKRKTSFGPKYDFNQPIVITFDSLNVSRSSTISILREYLFAEAKSKRGIQINKTLIKGMTAKEIPQQPNFSDCGLYLLAYVEKFVQDPDLFSRKLLRKDMRVKEDWPPLRSGLLRSRLRDFMELLYAEQEQLTKVKADEDTLMVDQQPISYLLGSLTTDKAEDKGEGDKRPQLQVERSPPPPATQTRSLQSRDPSVQPGSPKLDTDRNQATENAKTQEPVVPIIQPPSPHLEPPKLDAQKQCPKREVIEVPDSQDQASFPAPKSQSTRSRLPRHPPPRKTEPTDTVYVDDSDGVDEYPPQRSENGGRRVEVQIQVNETPPPESLNTN